MTARSASDTHEVIVVGLGAMGSAAAYQLASRGVHVLGLDSFAPPHGLGSTHGDTRITRLAIGEGLAYVPLAQRSQEVWRDMETQTGVDLLTCNGGLILGRPGHTGFHGKPNFLERTIAAADAFGIDHEVLDADGVRARFPQFSLVGGEVGYFEPSAGFVRPEACVRIQLALARDRGADIRLGEEMIGYEAGAAGVTVRTATARYSAGTVVLAVGPWVARFLDGALRGAFTVYRQAMHWFLTAPDAGLGPASCPIFIWDTGDERSFYGFPAIDGPGGGMKVATEQFEEPSGADAVERDVPEAESLGVFDELVGERLPGLRRQRVKAVSCLYTTTPDGDFVIDWLPGSSRVLLVSPCSGHGFKHSAAIGEVVAQLVTGGTSAIDLEPFSLARFRDSGGAPGWG